MAYTTTGEHKMDGLVPNSDNETFDLTITSFEKKFDLKNINEEQDSDDPQEEPDFDTGYPDMHASSENGRKLMAMETLDVKHLEESLQNMAGDIYQSTVKTATINQLQIGPRYENISRRQRRASSCNYGNRNSEYEPNFISDDDTTLKATSDEEKHCDNSVCYFEDEESVASPNNFDTKVNITMPNEGPPKIEVQITSHYHGPVFHLDPEATEKILSRDPNIIPQIYARETSALPNIIVNQPQTEMKKGRQTGKGESVIDMEGKECTTERTQHGDWLRRSSRKHKRDSPRTITMDVGQDESGNKTIGITFPGNLANPNIQRGNSLAQSNRSCWNRPSGNQRWWVTPLRTLITILSLLVTFVLMYYLVHWGNMN